MWSNSRTLRGEGNKKDEWDRTFLLLYKPGQRNVVFFSLYFDGVVSCPYRLEVVVRTSCWWRKLLQLLLHGLKGLPRPDDEGDRRRRLLWSCRPKWSWNACLWHLDTFLINYFSLRRAFVFWQMSPRHISLEKIIGKKTAAARWIIFCFEKLKLGWGQFSFCSLVTEMVLNLKITAWTHFSQKIDYDRVWVAMCD